MEKNIFAKSILTIMLVFVTSTLLFAQSQYDYYDDSAVVGGADNALNGILIIIGLIIAAVILILVAGGVLNVYYWFNPQANPEYKRKKLIEEKERIVKEKEKEEEKIIAQKRKDAIPEAIDLGLSVKWASFNLGAYKPSDIGCVFHWGDVQPSTSRRIRTNKINVNALGDISGNQEYDAATYRLGDYWRIPTKEECKELIENCNWETKVVEGVKGMLVTGTTAQSIFLPYNDKGYGTNEHNTGYYWTSCPSFNPRASDTAQDLRFGNGIKFPAELMNVATASRCLFGIRPVYDTSRNKTKKEKQEEIIEEFSHLKIIEGKDLDVLYKKYKKQCIIKECEKQKLFDTKETYKENIYTDEYGVVYSADRKRLLFGGDCNCETYTIKEGTEYICSEAFNRSNNLFSYLIPNKERTLKKIIIPSSVIYLDPSSICNNCEIVSLNPNYSTIDRFLIDNRKMCIVKCLDNLITEVVIGKPIKEIGEKAFINCEVLQKVSLPDSLRVISKNAFSNNEMLRMINLPNSIEVIEEDAFRGCKSLQINSLPNSLTYIGDSAFSWCNMDSAVIPKSILFIGKAPFPKNCKNLLSHSERFQIQEGLLMDLKEGTVIQLVDSSTQTTSIPCYSKKIGPHAFHFCDIESITIPSNIVEMGSWAFGSCAKLKEITFEGTLTCIPTIAFTSCSSLTSICLPQGVREIESGAFERCIKLEEIILNDDLKIISNDVFIRCTNLTKIKIPESVEMIGNNHHSCFRDCPNLIELYYDAKNAVVAGFPSSITKMTIGEHVEILPSLLVSENSKIETLTIPENVHRVSESCIVGSSKLREITIFSKDIILEEGWLKNCDNLERIFVHKDMYETLLPHLPIDKGVKVSKMYSHHFLFFRW